MNEQTTTELERDAERVRSQISDTAEHLKDKMSPGQLMDEVANYFKDGDTNQLLGNLKHQVRDNPLALALVGSGLAWLMMGSGPQAGSLANGSHAKTGMPERNPLAGNGADLRPMAASNTNGGSAGGKTASSAPGSGSSSPGSSRQGSGLSGSAAALGSKVGDATSSVADSATRTMHDMRDGASDGIDRVTDAGAAAYDRVQSTFLQALEREPLVLGALGVAVGAALGAMLPATQLEKDYLGEASAKARENAEGLVADGIDKAKDVGSDAYRAARDEADNQGLMPHGKPVADRVADVAKAAGNELKSAADDTVEKAGSATDETNDKWSPGKKS